MPERKVDRPCPPGQHRHGKYNYCHDVGVKHRAGPGQHGLIGETAERPRAKPLAMKKVGELRQLMSAGWVEPREVGNKLMHEAERLRGKVSQDVLALLRHASGRLQAGNMEDGMLYVDQAFRRYRDEITGGHEYEGKMKKAEEKRQDAEPEIPYEEDYAQIFEVDNRLKAVSKALEREIRRQTESGRMAPSTRQVSGELRRLEKRLGNLIACSS